MPEFVRPYVNETVQLLYCPSNPPPKEPPAELEMPAPGLWRVFAMWWYDHQPDAGGRFCRSCHRWYPCPVVISADHRFRTAYRQAAARTRGHPARGRAPVLYPKARNV
ncbi:MAG: hypothetical protein ACRDT6_26180 [Micromonosporaceae bacterium]